MRTLLLGFVAVSLALPAAAHAQLQVGGKASNFGSVTLAPGFTPDPRTVSVVSGGSLDVRDMGLGSGCVGYATSQPDYIVHLSSSSSRLRFYVEGDGDTGLVVNGPRGGWECNDDSYGGVDPTVTFDSAPSGQYDVWVTSYSSGDNISTTLHVTELDRYPGYDGSSSTSSARLSIGGSSANFGSVSLSGGFTPDPYQVSVTSGGRLDVRDMGLGSGCVGYATAQPDLIVQYSSAADMLRFYMEGDGDTALVVNGPDGSWHCNDDAYGLDPTVTLRNPGSGQYDIWVTSYSSDENITGTLSVTELESRHPQQ